MDPQKQIKELQDVVAKLSKDLGEVSQAVYKNNFGSTQAFNKDCVFNSRLRVPTYSLAPSIGEVGDLISVSGVLYICTTASSGGSGAVFTKVGSQ